ncbi:MAG: hypothetical protein AAF694_23490 [Bacteroidota bacterium]
MNLSAAYIQMVKTFSPFLFLILLLVGCKTNPPQQESLPIATEDPMANIEDSEAKELLEKALESMGGLDAWNSIETLSFQKEFTLYKEDGAIEQSTLQGHTYQFIPETFIRIEWSQDDAEQEITYDGAKVKKTINGTPDTRSSPSSIESALFSSTFVASLPYNLLDEGVSLSYLGKDTLDTEQAVEVLQAVYDPNNHANHTTKDIWKLYFDQESYKLVGYMVQHADHYSYVINLNDTTVQGFTFVKDRESYRVDSLGNRLYLRADYSYSNYRLTQE